MHGGHRHGFDPAGSRSMNFSGQGSGTPRSMTPPLGRDANSAEQGMVRGTSDESTPLRDRSDLDEKSLKGETEYGMKPAESIYSFHMLMVPLYHGHTGWRSITTMAYFLVFMNFIMQFGLTIIVGSFVASNHRNFVTSIAHFEHPWYDWSHWNFNPFNKEDSDGCRGSHSLCYQKEGKWTCSPPSVNALSDWTNLDVNGDGLWSRAEASDAHHRKDVQCRFGVDSLELFDKTRDAMVNDPFLNYRLHFNITEGIGIPKPYFDFYKYQPLMCQYGDEDFCGTMFNKGVFDSAIRLGMAKQNLIEIHDYSSARNLCAEFLRQTCRKVLPHTYGEWLSRSDTKCGVRTYTHANYLSPNGKEWQLTDVHFAAVEKITMCNDSRYQVYFSILLFSFFAVMMEESKVIYRVYLFVVQRGKISDAHYTGFHRSAVLVVNVLRTVLWCKVLYTGTQFLTCGSDYLGLIFDAISLVFIIEIDDLLYRVVLRGQLKSIHEDVEEVTLRRWQGWPPIMMMEGVIIVVVCMAVLYVTIVNKISNFAPLYDALVCLCEVRGEQCYEAWKYDRGWWDQYWTQIQPAASNAINLIMRNPYQAL